jgi:hypothetical protein
MSGFDLRFQPERIMDVTGRLKVSRHQNVYDADFEYGLQPLRWESLTANGGTIIHLPNQGGVRMRLPTTSGAVTIRQSRPYHRYQPGKTLFMATAVTLGPAQLNQRQRVGFFDDGNGVFFEQAEPTAGSNPAGMFVVLRSDAGGMPVDTRFALPEWNGDPAARASLDWSRIQMLFIEYAWYGAGTVRFGVTIGGRPHILHEISQGNRPGQTLAWSRTGNLPVRYEQRNVAAVAAQNDMIHYGVSVLVEGQSDPQRGFTYAYGMAPATPRRAVVANSTRFPVLSIRARTMGVIQEANTATGGSTTTLTRTAAGWPVNQWAGAFVFVASGTGAGQMARIVSNTADTLTLQDNVLGTPLAVALANGSAYQIGYPNRGQLLPRRLVLSSSGVALIELIASIPGSPLTLTGANFASLATLGSPNSLAERDVSATAMSAGEVVYAFTSPAGGSGIQDMELDNLFPLVNTIRGNIPDVLTVAVSTPAGNASDVGAHLIAQEAMS